MRRLLLLALASLAGCAPMGQTAREEPRELVVLLHGMGRSQFSMVPLQARLHRAGYRTLNVGYSSFGPGIDAIAEDVGAKLDEATERRPPARVHFVTHSLGGIVARRLIETDRPERLGRVVMLAPPNQGSHEADRLAPWLGWLYRPMPELRTQNSTVAAMAPPEGVEVAVITGDHDGKVHVDESRLEGADHLVIRSGHTFIMTRPSVARRVACFLGSGSLTGCDEAGATR